MRAEINENGQLSVIPENGGKPLLCVCGGGITCVIVQIRRVAGCHLPRCVCSW